MTLLDIPYNVVTALITALSIGIGVDYTVHIIHRFTEELEHGKSVLGATTTTLSTTGSALIGSALTRRVGLCRVVVQPVGAVPAIRTGNRHHDSLALLASIIIVPPMLVVWAA